MIRIPQVSERVNGVEQQLCLEDWFLLKKRQIHLSGPVDTQSAHLIAMQIEYLDEKDPREPIRLVLEDCPGGSVSAGMVIYDAMQTARCPVITVCRGKCASMGAVLFAAGSKGSRYILENAQLMCHQPSAGTQGMVSAMDIDLLHFKAEKERLNGILAKHTGQTKKRIARDTERDRWFTAEQAVAYGLADAIIHGGKE